MDRREYFKLGVAGAVGAALSAQPLAAQEREARATRGLPTPIIKDIQVISTQPV